MVAFNSMSISFIHKGHQINGVLRGDLVNWEFNSNEYIFRTYFPNGVLVPRIALSTSYLEYDIFLNDFYSVADKLVNKYT